MQRIVAKVTIVKTPHEQEYLCKAYDQDGKRFEDADTFESSRDAADGTKRAMLSYSIFQKETL